MIFVYAENSAIFMLKVMLSVYEDVCFGYLFMLKTVIFVYAENNAIFL
jgi:hypothetical protein